MESCRRKDTTKLSLGTGTQSKTPEATHRFENRSESDNRKIAKIIKLYNKFFLPKTSKHKSRGDFLWAKPTDTGTPEDHLGKLTEIEEESNFPEFSIEVLMSKVTTTIAHRKLRGKLLKENDLDLTKVVEKLQQNTYGRRNKKKTIPEALIPK